MSALTPAEYIALRAKQDAASHAITGWKYGDMASVSVPMYQPEPVIAMYLSRIHDHHFIVVRPSGKYQAGDEFFIAPEEDGCMTYLPDPVPSSATAGGSR